MGASFTESLRKVEEREGTRMKKRIAGTLLALFAALCLLPAGAWAETVGVSIDEANFPDKVFRESYVSTYDTNKDDVLSDAEIAAVKEINCGNKGIESLKGIEYFTALEELDCSENELSEIDLSKNVALKVLDCGDNELTSLDVSKNAALEDLACPRNQIASLDLSFNAELLDLYTDGNLLGSLDLSHNLKLEWLACGNNQLKELDVTALTKLEGLFCDDNELTSLDVTKNEALELLGCDGNQLTSLDVSKNTALEDLACSNNLLTELNLDNNEELTFLDCGGNQLTSLNLDNNAYLYDCDSDGNAYVIGVDEENSFDLSALPGSFDVDKAERWIYGKVTGSKLKVNDGATYVTYGYNCNDDVYAQFTLYVGYAVTFDTDGGSEVAPQTVARASSPTRPDDPVKSGYAFVGWYADADCTEEFDFTAPVSKATTVYAKWVEDSAAPVISGIEDGKTYCAAQKVTVTDEHLAYVTVDGTEVELDDEGSFTLEPASGEQEVAAFDKAGNSTVVTVTVNDGHTPETLPAKDATCTEDGLTEGEKCSVCGEVLKAQQGIHATGHKGGTATCAHKAKCETCGEEYGELDPSNHEALTHVAAKEATTTSEGNIEFWYCPACVKCFSDADATKEISHADTVIAKKSDSKKDDSKKDDGKKALPTTGDNTASAVALALAGGVAALGAALLRKKQNA